VLLDMYRLATPPLSHRPFADRPLQADDVPDAIAGRTAEPVKRIQSSADPASVNLRIGKIARPAPGSRNSGMQRIGLGDDTPRPGPSLLGTAQHFTREPSLERDRQAGPSRCLKAHAPRP
jgi:hypothetical protein